MNSKEEDLLLEARDILTQGSKDSALDELICECCSVSLSDIKDFKDRNNGFLDLELLKKELKLGSGCSSCLKDFKRWSLKV